nr:expressed conserved protein [Hymenolepis microstoma]
MFYVKTYAQVFEILFRHSLLLAQYLCCSRNMVDRHFTTYDQNDYLQGYRSTGGTRLPAAPREGPRNYFVDWYRPRMVNSNQVTNTTYGSCFTGDMEFGNKQQNTQQTIRWFNYGEQVDPGGTRNPVGNKFQPFACEPLIANPHSPMESTVTDFGNAKICFDQVTFKIFNNKIIPGYILYGIVYIDVGEDVVINKITINGTCNVHKDITNRNKSSTDAQVSSFKKEILTSIGSGNKRQPNQYHALTTVWDGDDLMEKLNFDDSYFQTDEMEWPFAGPVTLNKGTHAIPFAIRIPYEVNPTLQFTRKGEKRDQKVTVNLTTSVGVEVNGKPVSGGQLLTVLSDKLELDMQSCGGLPPVVNGAYAPGCVQLVRLGYKESNALIILEKKHVLPGDTLRIFVYTDRKGAVRNAIAELVVSYNIPEIGLSDSNDVTTAKESQSVQLLGKSSKKKLSKRINKVFISKISDNFPPSGTNTVPSGRLRLTMDDKRLMPESARVEGCIIEIKIPKNVEPSIEAGSVRIRHHVRIHMDIPHQRKPTSQAQMITTAETLKHNYTVKYIKFID